jgi:hypothetical protein
MRFDDAMELVTIDMLHQLREDSRTKVHAKIRPE